MKNIILFCGQGMSTSLLVNKMRTAAQEAGFECEINAHPLSKLQAVGHTADVILLGPQVRFSLENVKQECPGIPSETIDMTAYGMIDGKKVLKRAKELMGLIC